MDDGHGYSAIIVDGGGVWEQAGNEECGVGDLKCCEHGERVGERLDLRVLL